MKQDEFESYIAAARQRLLQKPKSLSEEGSMLWARVADQSFDFARNKELAHLLSNGALTLANPNPTLDPNPTLPRTLTLTLPRTRN